MMLLLILQTLLFSAIAHSHICSYNIPDINEVLTGVFLDPEINDRVKRNTDSSFMRIFPYYDTSFEILPDLATKKSVIQDAIDFWQKILKPKSRSNNVKLNRVGVTKENDQFVYYCVEGCAATTVCGVTEVPQSHLNACKEIVNNKTVTSGTSGAGVDNADYVLYISAQLTSRCSGSTNVLAYAAHCQMEGKLDRPVAGYINFCPNRFETGFGYIGQALFTAKHEILHALGFAISLYAFFRDENGIPYTPRSNTTGKPILGMEASHASLYQWSESVIKNKTINWQSNTGSFSKNVSVMVLPKVLSEARAHFNCPTMEGIEVEDQGGLGVAITHWEKRIMENDLMTATFTQDERVSRITLALMEDTGWYTVDYTKADTLNWGKSLGCTFATKSCFQYMRENLQSQKTIAPFCDEVHRTAFNISCNNDRNAYGYCNLIKYPNLLLPIYRYYDSLQSVATGDEGFYGSQVYLADYCPYVQEFNWKNGDTIKRTTSCSEVKNQPVSGKNYLSETYGTSSSCFNQQQGSWFVSACSKSYKPSPTGAGCYKYVCSTRGIIVEINGRSILCSAAGSLINITSASDSYLFRGLLVCPPCTALCPASSCQSVDPISNPSSINMSKFSEPCSARLLTSPKLIISALLLPFVLLTSKML